MEIPIGQIELARMNLCEAEQFLDLMEEQTPNRLIEQIRNDVHATNEWLLIQVKQDASVPCGKKAHDALELHIIRADKKEK